MSEQDEFDRIIASLYEAMLDESLWRPTSALIDETVGIAGTHLVLVAGDTHADATWLFDKPYWRGELRAEQGRDYAENYYPNDERVPRLLRLAESDIKHINELYTDRELKTSAAYNELLRRAGAQNGLNVRLAGPAGIHIIWAFADSARSDGWHTDQLAKIERLLPYIRQFVLVRHALVGSDVLGTSLGRLLDNMTIGVICFDWRGMITQANGHASAILHQRDGLIDRGGLLHARLSDDDMRLQRTLALALPRSGGPRISSSVSVARSNLLPRLALHVIPVDVRDAGFGIGRVAVLMLIADPAARPRLDCARVAAALGLTPAESRVAVALAEGATMPEIALATRRTRHTIRGLVKNIHAKLAISRRAELVRMVYLHGRRD